MVEADNGEIYNHGFLNVPKETNTTEITYDDLSVLWGARRQSKRLKNNNTTYSAMYHDG